MYFQFCRRCFNPLNFCLCRNCDKWKRAFPGGTRGVEEKTEMQVLRDTITRKPDTHSHTFLFIL